MSRLSHTDTVSVTLITHRHSLCHSYHTQTLSDPQKRATYDALFGFTDDSINPFNDPAQELDQVSNTARKPF